MTAREKLYKEAKSAEHVDLILAAAHEGMVTEAQVRELITEHNDAVSAHPLQAEASMRFTENRIDAHRIAEHLPGGGMRRNASPTEQATERIQAVDAAHVNAADSKQVFLTNKPEPCGKCVHTKTRALVGFPCHGCLGTDNHPHFMPIWEVEVEVEGFGKVKARITGAYNLEVCDKFGKMLALFMKERPLELDAGRKWCADNGVPIKPYEEGE